MVLPDWFIDQGSPSEMYAEAGLEAADIVTKVLDVLGVAQIGDQRA
jgi:1-deoxy-D-xylulose-5-phosphate synthase